MKHLPELQKQPAARDVNTLVRHTTKGPPIFVPCPKQLRSFPRENIPFKEAASKKTIQWWLYSFQKVKCTFT